MEGMSERYERYLRWRADEKLEEARENFLTKIDAAINQAKSCESDANRDVDESQRERELMGMEMDGRLNSLLGVRRDISQRLRLDEREKGDARDRAESLLRKIDEAWGGAKRGEGRESTTPCTSPSEGSARRLTIRGRR